MSRKVVQMASALSMRDRLVLQNLRMVERIARKLKARMPPCFELDDLIQAGMLGLLQAASNYDPGLHPGVAFSTFAHRRIRGEIQESVGMHSSASKESRKRRWQELTRPPIAECAGRMPGDEFARASDNEERQTPDPNARADTAIEARQRRDLVRGAVISLDRRAAKVIQMHYGVNETPLREIAYSGEGVDIGTARLSQIHTKAIRDMRQYMQLRGLKSAA